MRVLGIDPSSSITGNALIRHNGEERLLEHTNVWKKNPKWSAPRNLYDYYVWQCDEIKGCNPDLVSIESLSVVRSAKTTRVLSHYQAAAVLAAKTCRVTVVEMRVSSARLEALGRGNASKDEAHEMVKKLFPGHKFLAKSSGGYDETDAAVLGVAGPHAIEL